MNTLTPTDLHYVVRRLPKDVRELLAEHPLFVGGGFIRETIAGNDPKDIDFFGGDKAFLDVCAQLLATKRQGRIHRTDNALTLLAPPRMPVQFITRWLFTDPLALVSSFDFTVCQAVVWFDRDAKDWKSMCSDAFYPDLAARRLVYTFPVREEEAGGSLMRVCKFLRRGWNVQADSLAGVVARVSRKVRWGEVDNKSDPEREAAQVISSLLHEVDPLLVVDGLEPINEHERC